MEADESEYADASHVRGAGQHGGCRCEPGRTERKGRSAEARAVARSAEHSPPQCDEPQRKDDEAGVEQRVEHGLDAMPQQHQGGLILRCCPGSLEEVGERGGREVGDRSGGEQA